MKAKHLVDPPKNSETKKISPREPPNKKGKQNTPSPNKSTTPTKMKSNRKLNCPQCSSKQRYRSLTCVTKHRMFAHPSKKPEPERVAYMSATRVPVDHVCPELTFKNCLTLFKYKIEDKSIPKERSTLLNDNQFKMYDTIANFRKGISSR